MRLQLQILRHALPPVNIIHTTGTGPTSHTRSRDSTIAALLQDVNDLVPLESSDGEWGLEDYVVEVAATADQETTYECLHFQPCEAVLRDDDEVVIRALSTEDLRIRRLGGRHQITSDGRHLVDGITFGKQWLRRIGRPGVTIPPRKRRRLEIEDTAGDQVADLPLLLPHGPYHELQPEMHAIDGEDDDDDDDEDFVDDENDSDDFEGDGDEEEGLSITEENKLQITIREDFDDADAPAEPDVDEIVDTPENIRFRLGETLKEDEKRSKATTQRLSKRKRARNDEGNEVRYENFEGFSTPGKESTYLFEIDDDENESTNDLNFVATTQSLSDATSGSSSSESSDSEADDGLENIQEKKNNSTSSDDSSESETSSESDSESEDEAEGTKEDRQTIEQAKKRALKLMKLHGGDSSTSSDSSSEDEEMVRANEEDDTSSSGSDSSSASSDSDSDISSGSNVEEEDHKVARPAIAHTPRSISSTFPVTPTASTPELKPAGSAPGEGSARTHRNNDRGKRRRRLMVLKKQGILPENADLKSLREFEEGGSLISASADLIEPIIQQPEEGNHTAANQSQSMVVDEIDPANQVNPVNDGIATQLPPTPDIQQASSETVNTQLSNDPSPRRSKLDLASSRRMLFSALGVRTPKDRAAEAALREKLSKSNRPLKHANTLNSPQPSNENNMHKDDEAETADSSSWEDKLIVSAVECERDGWNLPPPPFPFQQGWAKGDLGGKSKNKRHARDDRQYYHSSNNGTSYAEAVSTLNYDDEPQVANTAQANLESSAASYIDAISVPNNFNILKDLGRENLVQGAVIAYTELQMDHTTNYQPTISSYKVGRIEQVEPGNTVRLLLAKQFWDEASALYDENTGERILGKFAISPDEVEDTPDDGIREIAFGDMITPKLVEAPLVEVPKSSQVPELRGGHGEDVLGSSAHSQIDVIQESAVPVANSASDEKSELQLEQVDITTPRRNEITTIIKEAGFDSVLDEQLLQPFHDLPTVDDKKENGNQPLSQSQGEVPHRFRHGSPRTYQSSIQDISSAVDSNVEISALERDDGNIAPSELDQESSPYMHTQETVEYPHISQIEINSSEHVKDTNSSSHQDAQRISPAPLVDMSFTISDHDKPRSEGADSEIDDRADEAGADLRQDDENGPSMTSEVPLSPSQDVEGESYNSPVAPVQPDSFLGDRGYDGQGSSYQDDGFTDEDSDGLPSIRQLTSSQQDRKSTRSSVVVEIPIKKSPQPAQATTGKSKPERRSTTTRSPEIINLPSQQAIESSESKGLPEMSQIPAGSQFIDLTQSSPMKDDDDDEAPSNRQVNGKNKAGSKVTKRASGIGNRRLLTKRRSYI